MSLIIFALIFILINIALLHWVKTISDSNNSNIMENKSCYITSYVKGTVRGIIGNFESNASLELKRNSLRHKNVKF